MADFDFEGFKDYVNTYDKQLGFKSYDEQTIINDLLYGVGLFLDKEEYSYADGYARFKQKLLTFIGKK